MDRPISIYLRFDPTKRDESGTVWSEEHKDTGIARDIPSAFFLAMQGEQVEPWTWIWKRRCQRKTPPTRA